MTEIHEKALFLKCRISKARDKSGYQLQPIRRLAFFYNQSEYVDLLIT